jgi:hypothetical protein
MRLPVGWYVHDTLGGVCRETAASAKVCECGSRAGWYFFPHTGTCRDAKGPFRTIREALAAVTGSTPRPPLTPLSAAEPAGAEYTDSPKRTPDTGGEVRWLPSSSATCAATTPWR